MLYTDSMSQSVSILTYNIHKGFGPGNIHFQLPKMQEALLEVDADIVLLQEVQGEHKRHERARQDWPTTCQTEFLAGESWPQRIYAKNAVYQLGHHGNAILSKFNIARWANVDVSHHMRASRSLLQASIDLPNHPEQQLHVVCIHFGLFKTERIQQVNQLIKVIKASVPADAPLIIAGDFNDWQLAITDNLESALQVREVMEEIHGDYAKSFPAWRATLTLDRIYYRGLTLVDCACLNAKPWRTLSDHLPLWARFYIS